jgi:hypothetical protein
MAYLVAALSLDLEWERPLEHRRGSPTRLDGIDVYYDFAWGEHFPDRRAQFRNGQCLAQRVREECPDGKTPALLLTDLENAREGCVETATHSVFVLNLPRYKQTEPDASLAYFGQRFGSITKLGPLDELAARTEAGAAVLAAELSLERIAEWAANSSERREQLRVLAGTDRDGGRKAPIADLLAALEGVEGSLDPNTVMAIARLFGPDADADRRRQLLEAITEDSVGRCVVHEVLTERIPERVVDARSAVDEYERLLEDPATSETDMQHFIETNPWLLGLDYAAMRSRQPIVEGTVDFLLQRFDGFQDLLELKSPQDPIVAAPQRVAGRAPAPSAYALSPSLANALAQAHVYRERLTQHAQAQERLLGLSETRDPRLVIVIGKSASMTDDGRTILTELNKSLHRVEVVPYDILAARARAVLDNVERYQLAAKALSEPAA